MKIFFKDYRIFTPEWYHHWRIVICMALIGLLQIMPLKVSAQRRRPKARVAVLPFENLSGRFLDIDVLMEPFYHKFKKIFKLSSPDEVDEITLQLRLRHTGFLSSNEASEIGKSLGVDAIILGMICEYQESPEPRVGLILKMIQTGEETPVIWMKSFLMSGNQSETWFGTNRIFRTSYLIDEVAKDMSKKMPVGFLKRNYWD